MIEYHQGHDMAGSTDMISLVEQNLASLAHAFVGNINNYFFTEKELHAYFYHLSMDSGAFQHRGHHLLHAEYPSPFKCSYTDSDPYVRCQAIDSKWRRSHIDCVLVNPRFIDWHLDRGRDIKELTGLENARFSVYMKDLYKAYHQFNEETGEAILLYAVEFKFLRHSYEGPTYPIREIHRDVAKLRLLREFGHNLPEKVYFVAKTKVAIFIGEEMQKAGKAILAALAGYNPAEYEVITRRSQSAIAPDCG